MFIKPLMKTALMVTAVFLLSSCVHVISKPMVQEAAGTRGVPFTAVIKDIDGFRGKTFIWGGFIVSTENTGEGTYIEVVQNPIDGYGRIKDPDQSGGRFLAFSDSQLDPLIFGRGRELTVAGELVGKKKRSFGDTEYVYPVIQIKEQHLWREINQYSYDYFIYAQDPYAYPFSFYVSRPFNRAYPNYPYGTSWNPWSTWGYPPYLR